MEQDYQAKLNRTNYFKQDNQNFDKPLQQMQNQQKKGFQYTENPQQKTFNYSRGNKFERREDQKDSFSFERVGQQYQRNTSTGSNFIKRRNEQNTGSSETNDKQVAPLRSQTFKKINEDQFQQKNFNFRQNNNASASNEQVEQPLREKTFDGVTQKTGYQGKNFDPNYKNKFPKKRDEEQNEDGEIQLPSNSLRQPRGASMNQQFNANKDQSRQANQAYFSNTHAKGLLPYSIDEGNDNFVTVLMVAEKPSIAKSIAEALGGQGFTTRKGICKFTNVFTFYGHIFGKKALIKVTSVIGHIYTTDFTQEYQDWRRVDPYKLFNATTQKKETNPDSQIIQHLQKEAMGASYLVLWLDNDREGENICFEVLTICKPELIKEDFQQIFRAKFSSITPIDIRQAYDELAIGPNFNESQAVDARQIIDLKVGVAFSRFQTRYLVRKYEELDNKKITFGPCQTPTLSFCVSRDDEIKQFVSQAFYKIIPKISLVPNELISLEWTQDRTYDQEEAIVIKQDLEKIELTTVVKVDNKETQKIKPVALNTVNFLKMASKQYGLGPQNAMQVAEKLYLGGYITYPRTESTKYPDRFDFNSVLNAVCQYHQSQNISQFAQKLSQKGIHKSRLGKDVGDHPPITPTNKVLKQQLTREEQNIYELVSRHFLASVSSDCRLYKKKVLFKSGNHTFSLIGTAVIDKGYLEALPWQKIHENEIPNFSEGDQIYLHSIDIHSGKTQPPDHLTESDLISLMEQNGIGTDASMAQHIANISEREYVKVVGQARRLVPTELGSSLIHSYAEIDPELVAPNLRSSIEKSVDLISQGELDKDQVLQSVIELFKNKYLYFVNHVSTLDKYFDPIYQSIETTISKANHFTKCGRCKNSMKLLDKIGKIFCERCKFMYGLPRNAEYNHAGECYCPVDGFQLVLVEQTIKGNTRRYTICPLCYQKAPEIENFVQNDKYLRTSCNLCTNRSCQFSMVNNEIGPCSNCKHEKGGRLVLDWPSEDTYTMTCNGCSFQYLIVRNGKLIRSQMKCANCNCFQVKVETNNGFSALGCLFCDNQLKQLLEERPPQEIDGQNNHKSERYFEKEINRSLEEQPQSLQQKPFKPRVLGQKNDMDIETEVSDQPFKNKRGRPPKSIALAIEKENIQDQVNKSIQARKPRYSKVNNQQEENDEPLEKQRDVDFVKKGIQKPVPRTQIGHSFQSKQQFNQQRQFNHHNQVNNYSNSLLEDSRKQDQEFFSKFNKNVQFQQDAETQNLLNDSQRLINEIESGYSNSQQIPNKYKPKNQQFNKSGMDFQNRNQQYKNIPINNSINNNISQNQNYLEKMNFDSELPNSYQNKTKGYNKPAGVLKQFDF